MSERTPRFPARWRAFASLYCFALAVALVLLALLRTTDDESALQPIHRDNPLLDLLGWLPANQDTLREYAVWVAQPDAPIALPGAISDLALEPSPLALGRSTEWQHITGISASQVTGWASTGNHGATILVGTMSRFDMEAHLTAAGYERRSFRHVDIWYAPNPLAASRIVQGDDLQSLNVIAMAEGHVVFGATEASVRASLEASESDSSSIANEPVVTQLALTTSDSGLMVVDQRDFAIACGVGGQWQTTDFDRPSGRTIAVVYGNDPATGAPVTTVWMQFADDLSAMAALPDLQAEWTSGFVNQRGFGGSISDIATVNSVYQVESYVVAELIAGRDNGWTRAGVRFLIGMCESASTLVPGEAPVRASPVASPSPEE